ncbi:MAG: imidazole glycerol phosphate synthase subunit HisH [Aestuariibacter sp.]
MSNDVVLVNTGCANIASLKFAIERLGYQVDVSAEPQVISDASKVILPGVGSANAAMQQINERGLTECLQSLTQPTLGICLGMQLMTKRSEEGQVACLGMIDCPVVAMQSTTLPLPHMGWNQVHSVQDNVLFDGISDGSYFYFVHGFQVPLGKQTLASSDYAGQFSAAIQQDNFFGVQFHPERSSVAGAQLLRNFIEKL